MVQPLKPVHGHPFYKGVLMSKGWAKIGVFESLKGL